VERGHLNIITRVRGVSLLIGSDLLHMIGGKMKRWTILGIMSLLLAGVIIQLTAGMAEAAHSWRQIANYNSKLCISIAYDNVSAIQSSCVKAPDQIWGENAPVYNAGRKYLQFQNDNGQCLGVAGASTSVQAKIIQQSCSTATSQLWYNDVSGQLVNWHSGLCIAVSGASKSAGAEIRQGNCVNAVNEKWLYDFLP
jgi:hypothetical protein